MATAYARAWMRAMLRPAMASLVTTTCPKCGAHVPVPDGADRATCKYCQTVSVVKKTQAMPATAERSGGTGLLVPIMALVSVLALCGVGVAVMTLRSNAASTPAVTFAPPVATPEELPAPEVQAEPPVAPEETPPAPALRLRDGAPVFATDLEGDGTVELIAPVSLEGAPLYAVFDAHTGAERVRTTPLPNADLLAVAGATVKRLIVTTRLGQLHAFDLASGAEQWTTALADSVLGLCTTRDGELHVSTADERHLLLDLTTGRQTETRATCAPLQAFAEMRADPRDRHDYDAPLGVEAYRCGGTRVMGSANFTVPDICHGKIPSSLDGLVAHRIWKHGAGWLIFGVRAPGRYVPKIALVERGRVVWSVDVPAQNPLEAEQGGPRETALVGTTLATLYTSESGDHNTWITAFDVADGRRLFSQELTGCDRVGELVATEDAFALRCDQQLRVLGATDGALRTSIGE